MHYGGPAGWLTMTVIGVTFWVAVIWLIVTLVRGDRPDRAAPPDATPPRSPEDLLADRFASGEIGGDEYRSRLDVPTSARFTWSPTCSSALASGRCRRPGRYCTAPPRAACSQPADPTPGFVTRSTQDSWPSWSASCSNGRPSPTLIMFPVLVIVYRRLATAEEHALADAFGPAWDGYSQLTPRFVPRWSHHPCHRRVRTRPPPWPRACSPRAPTSSPPWSS